MSDTHDDPFAMTTDVNGRPVPRWQERLQGMYIDYVPFGEILSYVRYLIDDHVIDRILSMSDAEVLAAFPMSEEEMSSMQQRAITAIQLVQERDRLRAICKIILARMEDKVQPLTLEQHFHTWSTLTIKFQDEEVQALISALA